MGDIVLITGGARSGKSDFALERAEASGSSRCFVATCQPFDREMAERIDKHRQARDGRHWATVEEPLAIEAVCGRDEFAVYLIDCLTLWISNHMADCAHRGVVCSEEYIADRTGQLLDTATLIEATVILVSNEVGLGIVPDNEAARRFRDLVGRCNRLVAAAAAEAVLVSCGLPIFLKKKQPF